MAQRYQVILINQYAPDVDLEAIKAALAKQFKLNKAATTRLFAQELVVVKKDLDAETAAHYKIAIDATGANSRIEPMPDERNYKEKRRNAGDRRKQRDRRKYMRGNTIVPDRRTNKDRRQD